MPSRTLIRPLVRDDREPVRRLIEGTHRFTSAEVATALELIDEWLAEGEKSEYLTYVLEEQTSSWATVRGYVCYGPTPLTEGTFDLYWIAVEPVSHGRGYGQQLLAFAESDARRRGGRAMLIETSSQESYQPTIRFYERAGYVLTARIPEYYRPGDDKLIFRKALASTESHGDP